MLDWAFWPSIVAAIALLAFAALFLVIDFDDAVHRAFALLMLVWAIDVALIAWSRTIEELGGRLRMYTGLVLPVAATHFALRFWHAGRRGIWYALQPVVLGILALAFIVIWATRQEWIMGPDGYGPLGWLAASRYVTMAALGLLLLATSFREDPPRCKGLRLVSLAFLLPPLHFAWFFLANGAWEFGASNVWAALVIFSQPLTLLLALAWVVLAVIHDRRLLVQSAPLIVGTLVTGMVASQMFSLIWRGPENVYDSMASDRFQVWQFGFIAMWTILVPVLMGFSIVRHRFFDIELKAKFAIKQSTLAGLFATAFIVLSEVLQEALNVESTAAAILSAVAIAIALRPLQRLAQRFVDRLMPGVRDDAAYRSQRAEEVYQAAFESAMQDGVMTEREQRILANLRKQLQLPDDDRPAVG